MQQLAVICAPRVLQVTTALKDPRHHFRAKRDHIAQIQQQFAKHVRKAIIAIKDQRLQLFVRLAPIQPQALNPVLLVKLAITVR
jgi:hypothetical protein